MQNKSITVKGNLSCLHWFAAYWTTQAVITKYKIYTVKENPLYKGFLKIKWMSKIW